MKKFLYFLTGAASGAVITFYSIRKHYESLAQEEIESVKKTYKDHFDKPKEEPVSVDEHSEEVASAAISTIAKKPEMGIKILKKMGYLPKDEEEKEDTVKKPYAISDEEFSEGNEEYDKVDLAYFSDGALAEDGGDNDLIEDIAGTVGLDFANHIGEYDEDVAYIRNDRLKIDYEILRDNRTYAEVTGKPYERDEG